MGSGSELNAMGGDRGSIPLLTCYGARQTDMAGRQDFRCAITSLSNPLRDDGGWGGKRIGVRDRCENVRKDPGQLLSCTHRL